MAKLKIIYKKIDEITPYAKNPRKNDKAVPYVMESIKQFGFKVPVIIDKDGTVVAGHTRIKAAKELGIEEIPCIIADDLTPEQIKAFRLADNKVSEKAEWDDPLLLEELELIEMDLTPFGFGVDFNNLEDMMGEADSEYNDFVDKFKPKHTTDDCFTPPAVYEAVKDWVLKKYNHKGKIIRPFYPGGDYQKEKYPKGCLVLDNPPFSIMSKIVDFYVQNKIDFFLFANHLTLFRNLVDGVNLIIVSGLITYENGVQVQTSFVTNLGDAKITITSSLHNEIDNVQPKETADLQQYSYPDNVVTSAMLGRLANFGTEMEIQRLHKIEFLDNHPETHIFGAGALISDTEAEKVKAEKVKAERAKIEKAKAKLTLSNRERAIIAALED